MEQGVKPFAKETNINCVSVRRIKIYLYRDLQVAGKKPLCPAKPSIRVFSPLVAAYRRTRIQ